MLQAFGAFLPENYFSHLGGGNAKGHHSEGELESDGIGLTCRGGDQAGPPNTAGHPISARESPSGNTTHTTLHTVWGVSLGTLSLTLGSTFLKVQCWDQPQQTFSEPTAAHFRLHSTRTHLSKPPCQSAIK